VLSLSLSLWWWWWWLLIGSSGAMSSFVTSAFSSFLAFFASCALPASHHGEFGRWR
jgi:hypothetical protein